MYKTCVGMSRIIIRCMKVYTHDPQCLRVELGGDTAVFLLSSQITSPGEGQSEFELLPMEQAMSDLFQHLEETESHVLFSIHISREHLR